MAKSKKSKPSEGKNKSPNKSDTKSPETKDKTHQLRAKAILDILSIREENPDLFGDHEMDVLNKIKSICQ